MISPISPVVPASINRVKRIAKQLHTIYPEHPLSKCQKVTAGLFFYKDWHSLHQATINGSKKGLFDDDISENQYYLRIEKQISLVCLELAEVDPTDEALPPEPSEETFGLGASSSFVQTRLSQCAKRTKKHIADLAVDEIKPTSEKPPSKIITTDLITVISDEWLKDFPNKLSGWWRKNIPYQPKVAECIEDFDFNINSRISLVKFGAYWGELCMYYAGEIEPGMAMGTAFMLAERYGSNLLHSDKGFINKVIELEDGGINAYSDIWMREMTTYLAAQKDLTGYYFSSYPRDDFYPIFNAQPDGFIKNARDWEKIVQKF